MRFPPATQPLPTGKLFGTTSRLRGCPAHTKELAEDDFENSGYEYIDWLQYVVRRGGIGQDGTRLAVLNVTPGETGSYWTDDRITVLSPTLELVKECDAAEDWNNMSYVLRIAYAGRRIILPGDACGKACHSILTNWTTNALSCDVLKAAHHGRDSGFHDAAVAAMSPAVVVCSVGQKPDTDASSKYTAKGAKVLSTRYHGSITATVWYDGEVWIQNASGACLVTLPPLP